MAAALAELPPDGGEEAEGQTREALAQAAAAAVPAQLPQLLAALLADPVLEVRMSALHACKTVSKLAPPLLRASGGAIGRALLPGIVVTCKDKRHMQAQTVAQRALLHVLSACGWVENKAPQLDSETASFVADFASKKARRLAMQDSEAEGSDIDP